MMGLDRMHLKIFLTAVAANIFTSLVLMWALYIYLSDVESTPWFDGDGGQFLGVLLVAPIFFVSIQVASATIFTQLGAKLYSILAIRSLPLLCLFGTFGPIMDGRLTRTELGREFCWILLGTILVFTLIEGVIYFYQSRTEPNRVAFRIFWAAGILVLFLLVEIGLFGAIFHELIRSRFA